MREWISNSITKAVQAMETLLTPDATTFIQNVANALIACYRNGAKVIVAGNGGSLCDAMHFAEELTGFFSKKRPALPALALSDPGHLTCVGNDVGFEQVFARGVEAHGKEGDLFIALTTSGNSNNLIQAVEMAKKKRLQVIAFLGKNGGVLKGRADCEWIVPSDSSARIQEVHMAVIHIAIEIMEDVLFNLKQRGATGFFGTCV